MATGNGQIDRNGINVIRQAGAAKVEKKAVRHGVYKRNSSIQELVLFDLLILLACRSASSQRVLEAGVNLKKTVGIPETNQFGFTL